jgi:hypothetical protein
MVKPFSFDFCSNCAVAECCNSSNRFNAAALILSPNMSTAVRA